MDHPELPAARKREFRKPFGRDKNPNPPSREECLEAIHLGLSDDNHGLRHQKDLINIVHRWAQADGSQLDEATRLGLTAHFSAVHDAWQAVQYIRFWPELSSRFQAAARKFLEYARDEILNLESAMGKGKRLLDKIRNKHYEDTSNIFSQRYVNTIIKMDNLQGLPNSVYQLTGNPSNYFQVQTSVQTTTAYINYFDLKEGIILTSWNYRSKDQPRDEALHNSEILWQQFQLVAKHNGLQTSDLKLTKIVGIHVGHEQTKKIMEHLLEGNTSKIFLQGSDGYYALLGTPVVSGKVYLLEQHKDVFGDKEITSLEVIKAPSWNTLNFVYHIGDKQ